MKRVYPAAASSIMLTLVLAGPGWAMEPKAEKSEEMGMRQSKTMGMPGEQMGIVSKRAEELADADVVNNEGDEIGDIEKIVRDMDSGRLYVVVSVGGFFGIGDKKVVIPLEDVRLSGNQLIISHASTKKELEALEAYDENLFERIPDERMVNVGTTGMGRGMAAERSFRDLDSDGDGLLSREEVGKRSPLSREWDSIDQNQDDQLDWSEFSAFEEAGEMKPRMREGEPGKSEHERMEQEEGGMMRQGGGGGY